MDGNDSGELCFESQRGRLTAIAARMLGDAHEAQDVVQDSYLRWQAAERGGIRTPAAWLTTVVQNLAIDRLRQRERGREHLLAAREEEPLAEAPEEVLARVFALSAAFARLRERLSEAERIAFVLHEGCEREHDEIARLLHQHGQQPPAGVAGPQAPAACAGCARPAGSAACGGDGAQRRHAARTTRAGGEARPPAGARVPGRAAAARCACPHHAADRHAHRIGLRASGGGR